MDDGKIMMPIAVWGDIIVDGHNRYRIACEYRDIPFSTTQLDFVNRYEAIVWICKNQLASHRDHEHLHNHFILNSVSFKDGEKFHCPPYYHDTVMAPESDKLCLEHNLSVIQNPQRKRAPYVAYMAEKKGKPSHRTLLKMDIHYRFVGCLQIPEWYKKRKVTLESRQGVAVNYLPTTA